MRFDFLALIPLAFAATDFGIANPATQYGMTVRPLTFSQMKIGARGNRLLNFDLELISISRNLVRSNSLSDDPLLL